MASVDARILFRADGGIALATPAALELLGLTLSELQALPPGSMTLEQDRADSAGFEAAWDDGGRAPIVGSATARLTSGKLIRLRYLIHVNADGTIEALLEPSRESVGKPSRMYTVGGVLSAWRAAQRKLEELEIDSPEWAAARNETEHFRSEYQRLSNDRPDGPPPER